MYGLRNLQIVLLFFIIYSCVPPENNIYENTKNGKSFRIYNPDEIKEYVKDELVVNKNIDIQLKNKKILFFVEENVKNYPVKKGVDFEKELLKGGFDVIDRTFIEQIITEQSMSMTGLTEEKSYIEVGKIVGAEGVLYLYDIGDIRVGRKFDIKEGIKYGDYVSFKNKGYSFINTDMVEFVFGKLSLKFVSITTGQTLFIAQYNSGNIQWDDWVVKTLNDFYSNTTQDSIGKQ